MSESRTRLNELILRWEDDARADPRDSYPYQSLLNELLFHADLRFRDYIQFKDDGEFPVRLEKWLNNFSSDRRKKAIFKLLRWVTFVDQLEMLALERDAFRRVIIPWLHSSKLSPDILLNSNFEAETMTLLRRHALFSITESFGFANFIHINDLAGTSKPVVLGENKKLIPGIVEPTITSSNGAIIFEDFVGTGKQAGRIVAEVRKHTPIDWRILFVPLIILESGLSNLKRTLGPTDVTVEPILVISSDSSLQRESQPSEPHEFKAIRTLIKHTTNRVLKRLDVNDDPPTSPFGYKDCGALLVTCNNAPNNTLPIFHHKAPQWEPLFRRVHHSKDHL